MKYNTTLKSMPSIELVFAVPFGLLFNYSAGTDAMNVVNHLFVQDIIACSIIIQL